MTHIEVAVAAPVTQTLTYALPPDWQGMPEEILRDDLVGRRIIVPLGSRRVTGYVLDRVPPSPDETFRVRKAIEFPDSYPIFHGGLVPFFKWVAGYYHYPLGLVIKAALPGGLAPKSVKKLFLRQELTANVLKHLTHQPEWLKQLRSEKELSPAQTAKILLDRHDRNIFLELQRNNLVAVDQVMQKAAVREKTEVCFGLKQSLPTPDGSSGANKSEIQAYRVRLEDHCGTVLKLSEAKTLFVLQELAERYNSKTIPQKDLRKEYGGSAAALLSLEEKGILYSCRHRIYRSPFGDQHKKYPRPEELTPQQKEVLSEIIPALQKNIFKPFLLHGVTGCGKTEVYLRAAEETLRLQRDVLILVPEIALATQLEAHLLSRFGDQVVLLHSGLSRLERFDQYCLALQGRAKIVIGARSAVFAPLEDPGLIVVDEEHDAGYKQDDSFRYHGRDIAVLRARHHSSVVILGSATPSITSYANARSGKYSLLTMMDRVGERTLPKVVVVDLNNKQETVSGRIIGKLLLKKLKENHARGKQSILLLNRRGFSAAMICQDCGTPVQCSHCHVSLTLHKSKERLLCHYCGFSQDASTICAECRSSSLVPVGFGTERIEDEVKELLPETIIKRLDSDTAADRRKFLNVLSDMHDQKIDILIGTQMIAKGHHFPNVTLVGVVWADGGMSMPDFRAAERTFQLVTQVIGRAGRGDQEGEVVIQTMRPEHYAIRFAREHQYEEMFQYEMNIRQSPSFPPYVRLISVRIEGKVESDVRKSAERVAGYCRSEVKRKRLSIDILGPAPSPIDKLRDSYRWQILCKARTVDELHLLCTHLKSDQQSLMRSQCVLIVDVDPENMM